MSEVRPNVKISDVRHVHVCGTKNTYCGHPRQGGIFNFGNGELALIHNHGSSEYACPEDVLHGHEGYHGRAVSLLQRSTDNGETWPAENNIVVFDESAEIETRRAFVIRGSAELKDRAQIDLTARDSIVHFGNTWAGPPDEEGHPLQVPFALRSADKGHTWESTPTVLVPPPGRQHLHRDNTPLMQFPDGTLLGTVSIWPPSSIAAYGSDDNGLTWEFVSEAVRSVPPLPDSGKAAVGYSGLVLLPSGRLQCYSVEVSDKRNAIQMCHSDDGYAWSPPRSIVTWGHSPWAPRRRAKRDFGRFSYTYERPGGSTGTVLWDDGRADPRLAWMRPSGTADFIHPSEKLYRSQWPMLLRDGRILVTFARRKAPFGIGGILSRDDGETWSDEFIIRDDASGPDIGYQVATELDDGQIFTAYYYMVDDGNNFGGSRFIGGSFFRLET